MGWWGFNVMEGDSPLDGVIFLEEQLTGISQAEIAASRTDDAWDAATDARTAKAIEVLHSGDIGPTITWIQEGKCRYVEKHILMQVLGEMIMCNGCPMRDEVKALCIEAAREDEWATTDEERKAAMEAYIDRVKSYNGTALVPTSRGLLSVITKCLQRD